MKHKFHNVEFSQRQQETIIEYCEARSWTSSDVVQSAIEKTLKVSFSWDNYHDVALLSLTPKATEHPFYGYILSVRHTDVHTLFKILFWLVAEGFGQLEPPTGVNGRYDW